MLISKAISLFCLIFMYLDNFLIKAQPPYPFYVCQNGTTYTPNSLYSRNLDATLSSLSTTNSGYSYFTASTGQGTDRANAVCLCRGDVELTICKSCLRDSIFWLRHTCLNQTEAIIYFELCLVKYSNAPILGNNDMQRDFYPLNNIDSFPDKKKSNDLLRPFMSKLRGEAAAGGSKLKLAMENTPGPENTTLYGLTQCIPILSEAQCNDCLEYAINQMSACCDGRVGVVILMARCNVRYEIYNFFTTTRALAPPSPSSTHGSSPPGKETSTSRIEEENVGRKSDLLPQPHNHHSHYRHHYPRRLRRPPPSPPSFHTPGGIQHRLNHPHFSNHNSATYKNHRN
ncbi:hypothetical protein QVD17_17180 [Tagetes erecta]|uniref:Gnk2-homologous domain-containing protein n=1 Tax=Tagetes erecta TaxID=13708 RepID=A0AAD8KSL4_TARER|nr:hypothetical protein QVD17_17180 [Tagetes erecta]